MHLPTHKTGCLWMRVRNKDWWEVVLLHFTVAEWKESFIMTGHTFIQHFIQNEEPLVPRVIRHYAISAWLHMRSPFSFVFQSYRVFKCTLNRIRTTPFNRIEISFWSCSIESIKVFRWRLFSPIEPSIRLQTNYLVACKHSQWSPLLQFNSTKCILYKINNIYTI